MWHAFLLTLAVLALSCISVDARAEPALVVLVRLAPTERRRARGHHADPRGAVADGFSVLVIDAVQGTDAASMLSRVGLETGAAATLGLILHPDAKSAEAWIVDRMTNKTVMRRIEMPATSAGSAPEVLARRSVELLRASLLEILVHAPEAAVKSPEARASAAKWVARGLAPSRWGVEAGAQVLGGFDGIGAAVMPVGRARFVLGRRFSARLTLAGLGTRPRLDSPRGSATVSQALGLFELVGEVVPQGWLRPSVSLGAGAYHVGIDGRASNPYRGLEDECFVFAADLGLGLTLPLTSSLALSLEGHATVVAPYPVIRFPRGEQRRSPASADVSSAHPGGAAVKLAWLSVFLLGCGPTYLDDWSAPTTLASGLVAHWTFDETSGLVVADDSGNRRDGVVSGATFESDGRFGGALHFAPGDSVTVERFPYAAPSWTFSAWIRIAEEDIETDDFGTVISTELMAEGGWQLQTRGRSVPESIGRLPTGRDRAPATMRTTSATASSSGVGPTRPSWLTRASPSGLSTSMASSPNRAHLPAQFCPAPPTFSWGNGREKGAGFSGSSTTSPSTTAPCNRVRWRSSTSSPRRPRSSVQRTAAEWAR